MRPPHIQPLILNFLFSGSVLRPQTVEGQPAGLQLRLQPGFLMALVLSAADLQLSLWLRVIFSWRLLPLPALLLASCRTEMKSEQSGA